MNGEEWVSPTECLYAGIISYELRELNKAEAYLDKALKLYPDFADAQYYKYQVYWQRGNAQECRKFYDLSNANLKAGTPSTRRMNRTKAILTRSMIFSLQRNSRKYK